MEDMAVDGENLPITASKLRGLYAEETCASRDQTRSTDVQSLQNVTPDIKMERSVKRLSKHSLTMLLNSNIVRHDEGMRTKVQKELMAVEIERKQRKRAALHSTRVADADLECSKHVLHAGSEH